MKRFVIVFLFAAALLSIGCSQTTKPLDPENGTGGGGTAVPVAGSYDVSGTIRNSVTGEGIAGVPVTDGFSFTVTNIKGEYYLKRNSLATKVYYTTPEWYEINLDPSSHVPVFYSPGMMEPDREYVFDFTLTPMQKEEDRFTLIAVGDPQCATTSNSKRFVNETLADIQKSAESFPEGNVYAVTLGDITYDSNDMWPVMKQAMGNVKIGSGFLPFFQCAGNHDHDATVKGECTDDNREVLATRNFVENFGPVDYSFDRKGVHIIVMDDIRVTGTGSTSNSNKVSWTSYSDKLEDTQYEWLDQDLALVKDKARKSVVVCMHAPVTRFSKPEKLIERLTGFGAVYFLTGHTHIAEWEVLDDYYCSSGIPVVEHILPTACGMWWRTNSDVSGCPAGYNVYFFKDGKIEDWYVKGAHAGKESQMLLYDGSSTYTGSGISPTNWYKEGQEISSGLKLDVIPSVKDCMIADVFGSDGTNWTVELYQNGKKIGNFTHAQKSMSNVCYAAYCYSHKKTSKHVIKDCHHRFWYCKTPVPPSEMGQDWEVVATQKIPGSTVKNVYRCSTLTSGWPEF